VRAEYGPHRQLGGMLAVVTSVLLVTGRVGVGKTAVVMEADRLLTEARVPHATIALKEIARSWPVPGDDEWNDQLAYRNLACVWSNCVVHVAAGAERLLLEHVLEQRSQLRHVQAAIPGAEVTVVRLRAPLAIMGAGRQRACHPVLRGVRLPPRGRPPWARALSERMEGPRADGHAGDRSASPRRRLRSGHAQGAEATRRPGCSATEERPAGDGGGAADRPRAPRTWRRFEPGSATPSRMARSAGARLSSKNWWLRSGSRAGGSFGRPSGCPFGRFLRSPKWWAARDSNPDGSPHTPLKRARLPVPPAAQAGVPRLVAPCLPSAAV